MNRQNLFADAPWDSEERGPETGLMHQLHRPMIGPKHRAQVRVGNPPLLYWAMQPLTGVTFVPGALISLLGLYVLSAVGFLAIVQYFGWKRRVGPTAVFLVMPPVVFGAYFGKEISGVTILPPAQYLRMRNRLRRS